MQMYILYMTTGNLYIAKMNLGRNLDLSKAMFINYSVEISDKGWIERYNFIINVYVHVEVYIVSCFCNLSDISLCSRSD